MYFFRKIAFFFVIAISACGGADENNEKPPTSNIVMTKTIQPRIATDVMILDTQKITKISSLASSNAVGQPLTINVADANQQGMLIASDENDNPLLFSIENNLAVGVDSTAYALVVMVMKMTDLPADLNLNTVQGNIRQVGSYFHLKMLIGESLNNKKVPLDSPEVMKMALTVLDDAIRLNAPTAAAARSMAVKAVNTNDSIYPYYFFNENASNKMWLAGADSSGIDLKNRTFLRWQVVLRNKEGQQLHKDYIMPMQTTTEQLYAYYGGSESSGKIPTALINKNFKIEVSQTPQTETANALALVNKSVFAIVDLSLGAAGVKSSQVVDCSMGIANALTNSPQFGDAVTSTNVQNWIDYFESVGGRVPELLITCNEQLDKGFGLVNASSAFKEIFYRFNKALTVARDTAGAINGFVQFNTHHNKMYTVDLCFKNGQVSKICDEGVHSLEFSLPSSLTVGQKGTLSALAKDVSGNIITGLSTLIFISNTPDVISVSGAAFTVLANGIAEVVVKDTLSGVTTSSRVFVSGSSGVLSGRVSCKIIDTGENENGSTVRFSGRVRLAPFQRMYVTGDRDIENFDPNSPFENLYWLSGSWNAPARIYNNSSTFSDVDFDLEYSVIVSGGPRHNTLIVLIGNGETGYKADYQFDRYSCTTNV